MRLPGVSLSVPDSASKRDLPLSFLGLQGFLKVFFHLRDVPAKFVWIYKGIWSARFPPRDLAFQVEIRAVRRKQNIGMHAASGLDDDSSEHRYNAIRKWMNVRDYQLAGPKREIYLDQMLEIRFPLKSA